MQITIDSMCRDSISAAPLYSACAVLRSSPASGTQGVQERLSFDFKNRQHAPSVYPEHPDLFIQQTETDVKDHENSPVVIAGFRQSS
jgi:myo-inositol-1-phosphate synthase